MNICDFCSVAKLILSFVGESKDINQVDFMYELFKDFIESDVGLDFDFDNGLVCRWLAGTAKISPRITAYYAAVGNLEAMAIDIEEHILPLLYDKDMAVTGVYNLLINDTTISENKKQELSVDYPCETDIDISNFLSRVLLFGMDRPFIKRDTKTKAVIAAGALSPIVQDYIYDGIMPKPCRHFCGRDNELEQLHSIFDDNSKIFIQGVAGIGKSEFIKKYAQIYKKSYTNILYFNYSGSLKQMITDCDFADDKIDDNDDIKFKRHNRFLRSLKEDTLIIIDNFNAISSSDKLFDVVMKYRCKIVFTTRSCFKDYTYLDLKEINDIDILLRIVEYFYHSNDIGTVKEIINEVHSHTLSVELAARLLASGILEPEGLLEELRRTDGVIHGEDKINLVKDGTSSKATYYEHIHKLVTLFGLSTQAIGIMRNMTLIPPEGILPRLFAKWIGLNNLNTINELIEYGFIQMNDYRKIILHPLIREIAIDDTQPSITACALLLNTLQGLCLLHGLDLPYHSVMFRIIENSIIVAEKDDTEFYLLFLKDTFPYMEKYAYRSGMELVITELETMIKQYNYGAVERAMLLDYKAAYEHICNQNHKKAVQYEQQAVKYCDELEAVNPHLAANIYGNIGGLYHSVGQMERAKQYMEKAYFVLSENNLQFTNDTVIQICNYANLAANMGEPKRAIKALEQCAKAVKRYNSDNSGDYANLLWDIGCIYMQIHDKGSAVVNFKAALKIYSEIWADEPGLMKMKQTELQNIAAVYGMNIKNLISAN